MALGDLQGLEGNPEVLERLAGCEAGGNLSIAWNQTAALYVMRLNR